jgi:hypothetical protein
MVIPRESDRIRNGKNSSPETKKFVLLFRMDAVSHTTETTYQKDLENAPSFAQNRRASLVNP